MPLFTDQYKDLESELIPLIMEGIKIPDFTTFKRAGATVFSATPRGYPNVTVYNGGIAIQCLEADKDSWDKKLKPLTEIFKAKDIPMRFGAKEYISVTDHSDPDYCLFRINVGLIELDRLLESESTRYKNSGNRNALYEKGNPRGIDGSLPFHIKLAIENTIFDRTNDYPVAYITNSNAFCLVCDANGDAYIANAFHDFYLLFKGLCEKYNIQLLPNANAYATSRVLQNSSTSIVKYEFNISPYDMEELLLKECPTYAGYRGSASISRLVDPNSSDIKNGFICLFPALLLADKQYIPRNAGCNMSEIISVQLANYIQNYLLTDTKVAKEDFFGHHSSTLTQDVLKIGSRDIFAALGECMHIDNLTHENDGSGLTTLAESDTPSIQICELNEDSTRIYQRHAVVTHTELEHLKSCEVPIMDFLDKLIEALNQKIAYKEKYLSDSPYVASDKVLQEITAKEIADAKQGIFKIEELQTAIRDKSPKEKRGLTP